MISADKAKNTGITKIEEVQTNQNGENAKSWILKSEQATHRILPMSDNIVRITYTEEEKFSTREKPGVIATAKENSFTCTEDEKNVIFQSEKMKIEVSKIKGTYTYYDANGKILLKDAEKKSKNLEKFQAYRVDETLPAEVVQVKTADGTKDIIKEAPKIPDGEYYHTRISFDWQDGEALYGLGQNEEGLMNLRGQTVYVHQANRKIAIPVLVSSLGYGILMDTYSPMIFNDNIYGSYLYTEADDEIDFYFMVGEEKKANKENSSNENLTPKQSALEGVVKAYRELTGKATMLPKWAFGYIQSQERYETQEEILALAKEHRDRKIGVDCLVLDWLSWEDNMWGQKTFDKKRFPDVTKMIDELHEKDIHFMLSIWPTMSKETDNYKEMKEKKTLLPLSEIYNALSEEGRKLYWKQANRGLFHHGIDAFWCDSSEPLTVEWTHRERMEPSKMFEEYCQELGKILPVYATNAFPFYHAMTVYDGWRKTAKRRVCNLTRSAYTGQQRLGTILWSGDTSASWKTLKQQIASGLNFVASGLPYWTMDIGAFFVKNSPYWYWDGDYDETTDDSNYLELYTRWYQWGAFLPVFRAHGTDCRREMWKFIDKNAKPEEQNRFYDAMMKYNRLRYQLMPYIYAQAGRTWLYDESMMAPLVFSFEEDENVYDIKDQYMFGEALMVCPVTEAKAEKRSVYLPAGTDWYDFFNNEKFEGGQWIEVETPLEKMPIFVKAGSILPMTEATEHVVAHEEITWTVYPGKDSAYIFYEDEGDGYGYENGEYTVSVYEWNENEQKLICENKEITCKVIG